MVGLNSRKKNLQRNTKLHAFFYAFFWFSNQIFVYFVFFSTLLLISIHWFTFNLKDFLFDLNELFPNEDFFSQYRLMFMNELLIHIHRIHDKIQFFLSFNNKQIEIQRQNFPNVLMFKWRLEKNQKRIYFRRISRPSQMKNILYNKAITAAHGYHF